MSGDNLVKLGHLARFGNGQDWKKVAADDGEFPVYGSGGQFGWASDFLHDGEAILFGRKGTVDHPIYVDGKFWTVDTMYYAVPNTDRCRGKYLYYWATTIPFKTIATNTALPSVTSMDLSQLYVPLPPLETQQRIADYLDRETAEIDAAVADLDRYVDLLEKRRLEMIRHKTQFDAQGSAWERCSTSVVFRSIGGGTTPKKDMGYYTSNEDENGTPWVTTSELRESLLQVTKVCVTPKALREVSSLRIHPAGSVAIAMYGATIGRLGILGVPATTNQACCVFSEPKGVDLKFFYYSLWADREAIIRHSSGGGQPNISQAILQRWKTPLPPLEAQREIADYLDHESDEIDALIAESTKLRDLLIKRRPVLITEVVTGRKQV